MTTPQPRNNLDGSGSLTPQSASHTDRFATSRPTKKGPDADAKEPRSNA